ncbi:MAG: hypothetical protein KAX49_05385 [Halanaerobiales bacterium]|nr:hypothetical protein [Halanaerobiales bacterium]
MKNYKLSSILIVLSLLIFSCNVLAEEMIKEIEVVGVTRTNQKILLNYLLFKAGDIWYDSYIESAQKSLLDLGIFNPMTLKIFSEVNEEDQIKVIIKVDDPELFYIDIPTFIGEKLVNALYGQIGQKVYNPLGNGMNFNASFSWGLIITTI